MCGIVGGTLYTAETIAEAAELLGHRGRDARGIVEHDGVWLAHNRLAIQDLSAASNQPVERDGFALAFNGELWRRTMDEHEAESDTRLLADLYGQHGSMVAYRVDGMFAFAVHNRERQVITLARDWLGRMPLYYCIQGGGIAFASEAKAITETLGIPFTGPTERDQRHGGVRLFSPGRVMVYDLDRGEAAQHEFRGWDCYPCGGPDDVEADWGQDYYTAGLRERLEAAVINELVADVPVCTILSGGVDSTIITALLKRHRPDIRAYTVSVGDSIGKDDLLFARWAAAAIGVELVEIILSRAEVEAALREAVWAVEDDRWVQVAPAIPQIALARRIGADGYKVVFGGEGADELFASYGDVRRWSWRPEQYRERRLKLCQRLHDNNLIRGNKAMMWGGTVELRTPFLDREVVDFCLRIPARYRADRDGAGRHVKYVLREAFRGLIPDGLLWRPKVAFQDGAHSEFLKERHGEMETMFREMFDGRRGGLRAAGLRA